MYVIGYGTKMVDLAGLQAWSGWQGIDAEMQRRVLRLMDASIAEGHPVGIGGSLRTTLGQTQLFLSRHHVVTVGGCCSYMGKRYGLNVGAAHAAPPGLSYHEPVTREGKCLAIDFVGDMGWLDANCERYGLLWLSPEPWHVQPSELPKGRSAYIPASMDPLKRCVLPGDNIVTPPVPVPTPKPRIAAPTATLKAGTTNSVEQTRAFQSMCNFWGWRDAHGRTLLVDGGYGAVSAQACMHMQSALRITVDGVYGPKSQVALQVFLDNMAAFHA